MTAAEVKAAVRRRYPASADQMPGPWTVLEEYARFDVLAFCAWRHASPARRSEFPPVIGHEVKVSRSDYRRELLRPSKRARQVDRCTEFYFVAPAGLLTDEEKAYDEPDHFDGQAFARVPCPARCSRQRARRVYLDGLRSRKVRPTTTKTGTWVDVETALGDAAGHKNYRGDVDEFDPRGDEAQRYRIGRLQRWEVCEACEGRGFLRGSIVEIEAPTLWIPRDVGLIEVDGRGCHVVRKSPINHNPADGWSIGELVRWVSIRPDPRHHPDGEAAQTERELARAAA